MPRSVDDDFPVVPGGKVEPDDDDGKGASPSNVTPIRRAGTRASPKVKREELLAEAEDIVYGWHAEGVGMTAGLAPVTSGTIVEWTDDNVRHIMRLASSNPKLLAAIIRSGNIQAYAGLASFVLAVLISVGVELNQVDAYGRMARSHRVTKVVEDLEAERAAERAERGEPDDGVGPVYTGERPVALPGLLGELSGTSP